MYSNPAVWQSLSVLCLYGSFVTSLAASTGSSAPPHGAWYGDVRRVNATATKNSTHTNTTSTYPTATPYGPSCTKENTAALFKSIEPACHAYVKSLQTCPQDPLPPKERLKLAMTFTNCTENIYLEKFACFNASEPSIGLNAFHITYGVSDQHKYTSAVQPVVPVTAGTCSYPDFMPIFEKATRGFFEDEAKQQPGYIQPYNDNTDGPEAAGRSVWAIEKTPVQYLRCTAQRDPADVPACVTSTISKLRWLPAGVFIYGGGDSCPRLNALIGSTALNILLEIAFVCAEVWWAKRKKESDKYFSWVSFCRALIVYFGSPILSAYALSKSSMESSLLTSIMTSLGIFLMTPKAASIIALVSGVWLGKGFGSQVLLVDTLVSAVSFALYQDPSTYRTAFSGYEVPRSIPTEDRPAELALIYFGAYLATLPGFIFGGLYIVTGFGMNALIMLAFCLRQFALAKLSFWIWIAWVAFFLFFFLVPFLAIWEVGWKVFVRDKSRVFPPLRFFRRTFGEGAHWLALTARYFLYWIWVGLSFTVFVGRWMFLVNFLKVAGDAFCPGSLTPAIVGGTMVTFGSLAGGFALRVLGLML